MTQRAQYKSSSPEIEKSIFIFFNFVFILYYHVAKSATLLHKNVLTYQMYTGYLLAEQKKKGI